MPVKELTAKEAEEHDSPVLREERLHTLEKRDDDFTKLLDSEQRAKYKLEVIFTKARRTHGLWAGTVSIWENGSKFHGGGDAKVYWCPGKDLGRSNCTGTIPDASNGYGYLYCTACKTVWLPEQVFGEIFYNLPAEKWAEVITRHYINLGHSCDVYLKAPREDIRQAAAAEQAKQLKGERLSHVLETTQLAIYPLKNLIKDVAAGADLQTRFLAFLRS